MHPPIVRLALRAPRRSRSGVALVMFAMLVFVFLAIAGIAIDVGMASLTQQQMQVAADTASLEGVRLRDYEAYQDLSNKSRRPRVTQMVRLVFDDDLHPTGGVQQYGSLGPMAPDDPDQLRLGAGPMMSTSGGGGPYAASETWSVGGTNGVWDDPVLQVNEGASGHNLENGDMVSGTYVEGALHTEDASYHRPDFATVSNTDRWKVLGFLVRMRRTSGENPLDQQTDIASHGPALPMLFGMGSLLYKPPGVSGHDIRRDGINVRATAIAVARPALRASAPPRSQGVPIFDEGTIANIPMLGLYPLSISKQQWIEKFLAPPFLNHQTFNLLARDDGFLVYDQNANGQVDPGEIVVGQLESSVAPATSIGIATPPRPAFAAWEGITSAQVSGYIALYERIPSATGGPSVDRIVGYGFGQISQSPAPSRTLLFKIGIQSSQAASVSEVTLWVAPNGVSAHLDANAPTLASTEWDEVFRQNHELVYGSATYPVAANPGGAVTYDYTRIRPGCLLAPALAR